MSDAATKDVVGAVPAPAGPTAPPPAKPSLAPPWEWSVEGVLMAGKLFTFAPAVPGQVQEYADRLLEVTEAFSAILAARLAFASGRAPTYVNAFENARLLAREYRTAETVLGETAREIAVFFEPEGVTEGMAGPMLKRFVEEALGKLGV